MEIPPPSLVPPPSLEYESIQSSPRTSFAARAGLLLWLLLLLAHTAAAYSLAKAHRTQIYAARPWFAAMAVGCLVVLAIWATIGTSRRHRSWDGLLWLLIAPTSVIAMLFDGFLYFFIRLGAQ